MRLLIDTNRLTDFFREDAETLRLMSMADEVFIAFITVGEVRFGFLNGRMADRNEARLIQFLSEPGIQVLYADEQTTGQYARLRLQLKRAGTPIPDNDLWIGALAVQHGLILVTRDAHFKKIPQLQLN